MAPSSMPLGAPTEAPVAALPVIGEDVCACQPQSFTLSLNLDGDCVLDDITGSAGVDEVVCAILDTNDIPVFDVTPVAVTMVMITELDQTLDNPIAQQVFEGNFTTGDVFEFQGFVANGGVVDSVPGLPGGLLLTIQGVDADGNVVDNTWVIDFSTSCGVSGVITVGQQVGWAVFVRDKMIDIAYSHFWALSGLC